MTSKPVLLTTGVTLFVSGLVYYLLFRTVLPWPGYFIDLPLAPLHGADFTNGTYPSLIFSLSVGLIAAALFWPNRIRCLQAIGGIWLIGVAHEITLGTFDSMDVIACTIGAALSAFAIVFMPTTSGNEQSAKSERWKMFALMLVSATLATGTSKYDPIERCIRYDNGDCVERTITATPVYLSYEELRRAVKVTAPRAMTDVSRVYLYRDTLFVNERNRGIHVIDNRLPANPENIAFIEIPGNNEISIRSDNLYADSYVDLVTLDLRNLANIVEVSREIDIFPYNSRQNVPSNVRFVRDSVDRSRGVVVGYR